MWLSFNANLIVNQSIHLMKLACPYHRWYSPHLQQSCPGEQQSRDSSINQFTSWHLPVCLIDDIPEDQKRRDGVLHQSIHLMTFTCPSHRWYLPCLQQRWPEEQQRRDSSPSINQSTTWHSPVRLIDDILLVYSRGDQWRSREEMGFSINQSTSWHLPVCLIDNILLVYSRGDQRSSRGEMF